MLHPEKGRVIACDLCDGEPKCIEYCPEEALTLISDDKYFNETLSSTIENLPKEIERISDVVRSRNWETLFAEAKERTLRLEEKLKALNIKFKPKH